MKEWFNNESRLKPLDKLGVRRLVVSSFERNFKKFFHPGNTKDKRETGQERLLIVHTIGSGYGLKFRWSIGNVLRALPYAGLGEEIQETFKNLRNTDLPPIILKRGNTEISENLEAAIKGALFGIDENTRIEQYIYALTPDNDISRSVEQIRIYKKTLRTGDVWIGRKWTNPQVDQPTNRDRDLVLAGN